MNHVLLGYSQSLLQSKNSPASQDIVEYQCQAAWRMSQWDLPVPERQGFLTSLMCILFIISIILNIVLGLLLCIVLYGKGYFFGLIIIQIWLKKLLCVFVFFFAWIYNYFLSFLYFLFFVKSVLVMDFKNIFTEVSRAIFLKIDLCFRNI